MEYVNDTNKEFLNSLILSKDNISEQLRVLRKYRDRDDVQEYIKNIESREDYDKFLYTKYLIDKYYYNKKNLVKPDKNCIESFGKLQLQPVQVLKKRESLVNTDIKLGDKVVVYCKSSDNNVGNESNIAVVEDMDLECGIAYIRQNIFGEDIVYKIDIEDIPKVD